MKMKKKKIEENLTVIVILENLFIIPKPVNLFLKLKSYV